MAAAVQDEAFRQLDRLAPLVGENARLAANTETTHSDADPSHPAQSIVRREAVLGTDQRVAGYSFTLRHGVNLRVMASSAHVRRLYDEVLLRNIQAMELQRLLGHRLAFVAISAGSIGLPRLEQLPSAETVFVVGPNDQLSADPEAMLARLSHFKSLGYRIGLHGTGAESPEMTPFLKLAEFLLIDIGANDIPAIKTQIECAREQASAQIFVATNIQTLDEFNVCAKLPFAFFQGPFVTSREQWSSPRMDTGRLKILQLLNKLRQEAEVGELTALIKQDPALSFKLLRYINSPGMGLLSKVGTPEQALFVLGRQKLYRWLTLLLFTSGQTRGLDQALLENALVRARLAELLARDALSPAERDEVFVAGVFSLLDVLLGAPMETVLKQVSLPALVNEALLHRRGIYAPYLQLAIACEQSDEEDISALAQAIGLDAQQVNDLHIEALSWAQQVGE
jgi:EAL and modified HD-GYP domain-containing signal transduction protein